MRITLHIMSENNNMLHGNEHNFCVHRFISGIFILEVNSINVKIWMRYNTIVNNNEIRNFRIKCLKTWENVNYN